MQVLAFFPRYGKCATFYSICYTVRKWDLLLECVREITIYAFAYDNYNYAPYLPAFFGEMMALETTHPEVYKDFQEGQFAVQLSSNNPFGRIEAEKKNINYDKQGYKNTRWYNKLQHKPKRCASLDCQRVL